VDCDPYNSISSKIGTQFFFFEKHLMIMDPVWWTVKEEADEETKTYEED